jgi:hypothetical protein
VLHKPLLQGGCGLSPHDVELGRAARGTPRWFTSLLAVEQSVRHHGRLDVIYAYCVLRGLSTAGTDITSSQGLLNTQKPLCGY